MEASPAIETLLARTEQVVSPEELRERLDEDRPLRVKLGVDPTAREVTLGWAVPLRKLREFQDGGHTAVLIIGDFTARIGDPSGKSATRPQLDADVVRANAEACVTQLLDILSEERLEVRYNSEWLEPLDLAAILRLTSEVTVAQMLERDDFANRFRGNRPISLVEFMYPLLQAYDSVAIAADVELGGTDQLFNLLVGRDLQRAFGQRPQVALTMPLLVGTDGVQKMSQSLGNYIAIRSDPADMFGKVMSIPDGLVGSYALLGAWLDAADVARLAADAEGGGPAAARAKRAVARAVVARLHGDAAGAAAEESFDRQFREHDVPEDVPEIEIPGEAVAGDRVSLPILLAAAGLASSRSDARRLIAGGGVRIDGVAVEDEEVDRARLTGAVLQVGRRRFARIAR